MNPTPPVVFPDHNDYNFIPGLDRLRVEVPSDLLTWAAIKVFSQEWKPGVRSVRRVDRIPILNWTMDLMEEST